MKTHLVRLALCIAVTAPVIALPALGQGSRPPDATAPASSGGTAAAPLATGATGAAAQVPPPTLKPAPAVIKAPATPNPPVPKPAAAGQQAAVATPSNLRFDNGHYVADWLATPAATTCWSVVGTPDVGTGKGTYTLTNGSKACLNTLGIKPTAATIDSSTKPRMTFADTTASGTIHSMDSDGRIDRPLTDFQVAGTQTAVVAAGILFSDTAGYYPLRQLTSAQTPAPNGQSGGAGAASIEPCPKWDAPDDGNANVYVDLPRGSIKQAPPRNVVLPNQGLTVVVCYERGQTITVAWGGTRGLTVSTSANANAMQARIEGSNPPTPIALSEQRFSPRQSGSADVTIKAKGADAPDDPMTVELEVDTLYWGAVRLGLGTLFDLGQNWHKYSATTFAGSLQPEISQAHDTVGFEIVSGFAPYLLDLFCPGGGRSFTGGCNLHFAPFVGFGVLGTGTAGGGVQALSSVHFGLELEFAKSFSIALTGVARRTQALNNGYAAGSPVTGSMTVTDFTHDDWKPGLGVVVNATPSFLQFALGSGTNNPAPKNQ
jgi:hypothetical protein